MNKINLPPHVLNEIASTALTKAKVNVFLSKKETASALQITTRTVDRIGFNFTYINGQNMYNIKDILAILDKNYTDKGFSKSKVCPHVTDLLHDYTQILIKIIMIDNPQINLNSSERWIFQNYLIKLNISGRKLYHLRKTRKLAFSTLSSNQFYYKITDIIDCFKELKKDDIDYLVKNSLFYLYLGS